MLSFFHTSMLRGLAVVVLAVLTGCNSTAPEKISAGGIGDLKSKGTVGVSVLTLTNPFFRVIGDHLADELKKAGYETVVVAGEYDVAKQQQQVRDFIVAKHAAIVLCPCDSKG